MRSEIAIAGAMLAARRVAELRRVISFGFDETTKFQVGTLSTNVQGKTTDGRVIDIVLRGAFVIAGGTPEHVVDAVEKKLFVRGRMRLGRWIEKFNEIRSAGAAD
eukprot:6213365-Pleurochrysis_carterae.AAC.1